MDLYLRGELISGVGAYNRMYFFCLQVDGPISLGVGGGGGLVSGGGVRLISGSLRYFASIMTVG